MVSGAFPKGFPLAFGELPSVNVMDRMTPLVHGADVKLHPVTGLPIEDGSGCLPPDEQARRLHLPIILERHGIAAAKAALAKLNAAAMEK